MLTSTTLAKEVSFSSGERKVHRYANGSLARAMLMFNFVYDYAYSRPELRDQVLQLGGGKHLVLTFSTINTVPVETRNAIRALVLPDQ